MTNTQLQKKVMDLHDRIKNDFYLCRDDITVSGKRYNSALLFGVLTELNRGNQLLFGEYGGGKTTSAEYLHSLFNGLPLDLVRRVAIRADPQKTDEKMVARPDYGRLYGQEEKVVWQHFVLVGPKIVDEFNRLPESNQSILLNGVDRGEWSYLNDSIFTEPQAFFATCNYTDRGNNSLIPPMLDRFDVAVESKFPGVPNAVSISQDYHNERQRVLSDPKLTREALKILNSGKEYEEVQKDLRGIVSQHTSNIAKNGFHLLSEEEKVRIEEEIKGIPLDKDAETYFAFLVAELNISSKYGQKRSTDQISQESGLYLQTAFIGSGSRREEKSMIRYAKSLAWLQSQDRVTLDHLIHVSPYVLWHRLRWTDDIKSKLRDDNRDDPFELYITKTLLGDGTQEMAGVKKRFIESKENYQRVMNLLSENNLEGAIQRAEEYSSGGKGHPIFIDLIKELR